MPARSGPHKSDDSEVTILGRTVRWKDWARGQRYEVDEVGLHDFEATKFRGLVARLNSLPLDCPDFQFPAIEVCRDMSFPTASRAGLKRLARCLVTRKVVIYQHEWQDEVKTMTLYKESDWVGFRRTRKFSSGDALLMGTHCVKTWSCTQRPVALSSAEAEYYSMVGQTVKAPRACRLFLERLDHFFFTDSSAAKKFFHEEVWVA